MGWQKKMSSNFYECYLIEMRRLSSKRETQARRPVQRGNCKWESWRTLPPFRRESQWLRLIFPAANDARPYYSTCNTNDTAMYPLHWNWRGNGNSVKELKKRNGERTILSVSY